MALKNLEDSDDWYRICGIHGNTFRPNDPQVLCPTDPDVVADIAKTGEPMYCAHSVEPFIAWHVPYLYEFEQLLNIYDMTRGEYIALPYFDITDDTYDYSFLNDPHITILYEHREHHIRNPLASAYYYNHGIKTHIVRNGIVHAKTPKQRKLLKTLRRQLFDTLHAKTYEEFSSQLVYVGKRFSPYPYRPLESPHNSIHDIIGGTGGNMSSVDISAFDPVFWLHHANMDRFFYNWLLNSTSNTFSEKSLDATLAPFALDIFGWENNTPDYLKIRDVVLLDQYPYTYNKIWLHDAPTQHAYIHIIDIPIPPESVVFDAYIYPKSGTISESAYAGSVSWFGLNRSEKFCRRCECTRTTLTIDVLDFIKENGIKKENMVDYNVYIECNGRIIKDVNGKYNTYKVEEMDGKVSIDIS